MDHFSATDGQGLQIVQITMPPIYNNLNHWPQMPSVCEKKSRKKMSKKSDRTHLKRSRRHKFSYDHQIEDDILSGVDETTRKEERRKSIREKMRQGQEYLFTKQEERDIHERAESYCMAVTADDDFYLMPDEQLPDDDPAYLASKCGLQLAYPLPKKRKRRNYLTDSCYLTYHNKTDPYDSSHKLGLGCKLLRPPDKLVELVAQAIDGSPDGLLQVPQIYYVLMNRYPYFRYMDRSALGSWRSSIRHALYQKWFRKIRFGTHSINTKGCYWANNHNYCTKESPEVKKKKRSEVKIIHKNILSETKDHRPCLEDFALDPNTHDNVVALLNEEEENGFGDYINEEEETLQDMLAMAKEYGLALGLDEKCLSSLTMSPPVPSPVRDPDPVLSTCIAESRNSQGYQDLYAINESEMAANLPLFSASHPWSESNSQFNSSPPNYMWEPISPNLGIPAAMSPSPILGSSVQTDNWSMDTRLSPLTGTLPSSILEQQTYTEFGQAILPAGTCPVDSDTMPFDIEQLPELYGLKQEKSKRRKQSSKQKIMNTSSKDFGFDVLNEELMM